MSLLRNKQLRENELGEKVANCTLYALRPWYEGDLVVLPNNHEDKAVFRDVFEHLGRSPSPEKYVRNWCWPLRPARVRTLKTMPRVSWRRLATFSKTRWPPIIHPGLLEISRKHHPTPRAFRQLWKQYSQCALSKSAFGLICVAKHAQLHLFRRRLDTEHTCVPQW